MSISRRRFVAITMCSALASNRVFAASDTVRWRGIALGARADLRIVGMEPSRAEFLLAQARAEIERLERQFSLYRPNSDLVRLNTTGLLENPTGDMLELCTLASSLHKASGGRFDPSIQPLWAAYAQANGLPSQWVLEHARAAVGWDKVSISSEMIRLIPNGALTFNGIAQGFITDRVVHMLKAGGLETGLVSVGEIAAIGAMSGAGWPVGLAEFEDGTVDEAIKLRDQAVATSSPRGTVLGAGDVSHIIDPRTGRSAAQAHWKRVSIVHRSAAVADGLSTAGVLMDSRALSSLVSSTPGARMNARTTDGETILV